MSDESSQDVLPEWKPLGAIESDLPEGPAPGKVTIAYLSGTEVANGFLMSLLSLRDADQLQAWGRLDHRAWWVNQRSGVNVSRTRNAVVKKFLEIRDPAPEWLLMVDADMTFDPTALELLVRAAEASREDDTVPDIHVIGGLCAAFGNDGAGNVRIISTVFDVGEDKPGIGVPTFRNATAKEVPFKSIKQVYGTGAAFLLIHRQVLVDIAAAVGKLYPWFREQIVEDDRPDIAWHERNDYWISEDLFFCMQAQRCGYPIFVHTGVEIGHIKSIKLTPDLFRFQPTLVEMA